ncbi:hypothetical protein SESBI_08702 [Sesbania bispinosa]|nr:hypothetical protein SESBI_08702 [Sesbania bispinosa]
MEPMITYGVLDRSILWRIGDTLGKTIKIDANTLKPKDGYWGQTTTETGKFARVCIEEECLVKVNTENIPMVDDNGTKEANNQVTVNEITNAQVGGVGGGDVFGSWMLVQKSHRKRQTTAKKQQFENENVVVSAYSNGANHGPTGGSRFSSLRDNVDDEGHVQPMDMTTEHEVHEGYVHYGT